MTKPVVLEAVAEATQQFAAKAAGAPLHRIEVKVASRNGMPLLCAVEAALRGCAAGPAPKELVWLSGGVLDGAHRLELRAFGEGGRLIAEALYAFDGAD